MRAVVLVLLVTTSAFAVTTVQFAKRASAERERADAELALRQTTEARVRELEQARSQLEQQLALAQSLTNGPVERAPEHATPPLAPSRVTQSTAEPSGPKAEWTVTRLQPSGDLTNGSGRAMALPRPPASLMRAQARSSVRRMHWDVGKVLGLSDEETEKLLNLLADQQARQFDARMERGDFQSVRQAMEDARARNDAEIAQLIGPHRMQQWMEYQSTLAERSQIASLDAQFETAGMPLTADQRTQLVEALLEAKKQFPPPPPAQGTLTEDVIAQNQQWQEEVNRAVLERARSILSREQYEHYVALNEWQSQMRQLAIGRAGARGLAAPAPGGAAPIMFSTFNGVVAEAPPPPPR
jgi:hypothetical protein